MRFRLPLLLYMVLSPLRGRDTVHFGEHRDEVVIGVARHFGNRIDWKGAIPISSRFE